MQENFVSPATLISEALDKIRLPTSSRPPIPPNAPATKELVEWGIAKFAYAQLAHMRTVLRGTLLLADAGIEPAVIVLCRHLYEWNMQTRFSVHASIANYQNEARSGLYAMRPWQELASDLGPTALGSREPFGRSSPIRRDRTAAGPKTRPSCSSHNRRPSPGESIQGRAPFESSVHCT
jgi:hypothetical protein